MRSAGSAHLDLSYNKIRSGGAKSLARVLAQCTALAHLDLNYNNIGAVGGLSLGASWRGQAAGLLLEEDEEQDEDDEEV